MFADVKPLPPDPILGLSAAFKKDPRADKIDLGVGVFRDLTGNTPVMAAVAKAEATLLQAQNTKVYIPVAGAPGFAEGLLDLLFGADHPVLAAGRVTAIQAAGGCGSLRVGGELLASFGAKGVTTGAPTWPNHGPLLGAAGLALNQIDYYDGAARAIDFPAFEAGVRKLGPGDVLLLHGPCHNPTGADLAHDQIRSIADLALEREFTVLVDCAYHGFASDLENDAFIVRELASRLPELLVTYSCSKNFGLYRERTGALIMVGRTAEDADALKTHAMKLTRANYSMPPAHGGSIVSAILNSGELSALWRDELAAMTKTVKDNRAALVAAAAEQGLGNDLGYISDQNGMFSLLPLTRDQVAKAREEHGVYIVGAGRINLCGVNAQNAPRIIEAYRAVTKT
ncbi:MAG: aromatic amino acid transaminase [Pseudomonadota bacterium]